MFFCEALIDTPGAGLMVETWCREGEQAYVEWAGAAEAFLERIRKKFAHGSTVKKLTVTWVEGE